MKTLKEKREEYEIYENEEYGFMFYADVKKAVLEFEKRIIKENKFTKGKIFKIHKEIFGDFEK